MRKRTEEINVRVYATEKNTIRRKARKLGMNTSEYLRTVGLNPRLQPPPAEDLMLAYQKLQRLPTSPELSEISGLLLKAYYGKEDADGSNENLGDS